ncbi:hypothetical protein [Olsenella profusa]|uniref:Uncharacterized protein n=1 Tax=Olsenella profusa TaxID=138595 RepID=A0ABS2F184_9ACTN|nr:hypothetical protein [Olsenella profusa]MBM6774353.1 hypothetical protein [Olsenella profusa]
MASSTSMRSSLDGRERTLRLGRVSSVLAAVAAALALFGGVGLWGVFLPLLGMPDAVGRVADTLLQVAGNVQSALPFAIERLDQLVEFLRRLSEGDLAWLVAAVTTVHAVVTLAALVCAVIASWRRMAPLALASGVLSALDVGAVWYACSVANVELYLALRSVAEGNPWAVGRGVAGLPAELAPNLGMQTALVLAVLAIALAAWALVRARRAGAADAADAAGTADR